MEDVNEITLPISGKIVQVRNFTTRNDDEKADEALYRGVGANGKPGSSDVSVDIPLSNIMNQTAVYVRRLVVSVDGVSGSSVIEMLGKLRTQDYEAVEEEVQKVVDSNSPKAKKK